MTDTAVPLPEPIDTDAVQDDQVLRPSQRRRVEALQAARQILEIKPGIFTGSKLEPARSVVVDLMTLADWIIDGPDRDNDTVDLMNGAGERVTSISTRPGQWADVSPQTAHDASARAYFESGWEAVRTEVLSLAEQVDSRSAVDWIRDHPAAGRLADTGSHGPDGGFPSASDPLADADLRAARSDADDGN